MSEWSEKDYGPTNSRGERRTMPKHNPAYEKGGYAGPGWDKASRSAEFVSGTQHEGQFVYGHYSDSGERNYTEDNWSFLDPPKGHA